MGLADFLIGVLGPGGLALALFLIFVADAAVFPALPEIWIAFAFPAVPAGWDVLSWGILLLALAVAGEAVGNSVLYAVVRHVFVTRGHWPRFLEKAMRKWTEFLVVRDERIILVNRVAPVVPFVGAFIAVLKWDYKKSLAYIVLGATVKYTALIVLLGTVMTSYPRETAEWITIVLVLVVVGVSAVSSLLYRRRLQRSTAKKAPPMVG